MSSPITSPAFRSGPSGWRHPDWLRSVYPVKNGSFHELEFLASFFDTVEIPVSHQPLRPELSALWVRKVAHNAKFRFTVQAPVEFTHERRLDASMVEAFRESLRPLAAANRLGCVLLQFPWAFRFTEENREYFIQLRRALHAYPLVAEMRHASWMRDEALGVFVDYHVGFVNLDQPCHVNAMPPTAFLTTPVAYVRLHGRGEAGQWFQRPESRDYLYSTSELAEWKQRLDRIRKHASETYVLFANHAGGKSVVNALQMKTLVEGVASQAPGQWRRQFARELRGYLEAPQASRQPSLLDMCTKAVA
ncbi:MAG: DUF72 domain-containing protein [Bryobacterales bacterium]|nr:DUF72 domain-containing protein [Bryobacterales bacterium]